jgi:hypothetical protein
MGLIGDIGGMFGISKTGILAGALKMVGVPEKAAHAIGLAAELARGFSKDGFDLDKVNKGALARHALKAFGVHSPGRAMALTAALNIVPKGFVSALIPGAGMGMAALGAGGLAASALGGLAKSQLGLGGMLAGLVSGVAGGGGLNGMAGFGMNLVAGGNSANLRTLTGTQRVNGGPGSAFAALPRPAYFEDIVAALMVDHIKDKQEKIEAKLKDLQRRSEEGGSAKNQAGGFLTSVGRAFGLGGADDASKTGNSDSRNIEFEMIKNEIQKLSQMQQAMSNVLNTMNELAMSAIRHIKAG